MLKEAIRIPTFDTDFGGWNIHSQNDFSGGENRQLLPEFLTPSQCQLARNMAMSEEGVLETRYGKVKVNTTSLGSGGVLSVHRYAKENGDKYLVVQHGTSLYSYAWDGSSQFSSFGAAIKTGLTASAKLRSVVWKDQLILFNGSDNNFRFDGSTCTDLAGSPPAAKIMKVYANRLFLVDASNPNYVRFSDLEDYDTWPALNIIKVRDGDGDFITGLSPQTTGLIIAKTKALFPLYGTNKDNIRLGDALGDVGCISIDGLVDQGLLVAQDNWYTFDMTGAKPQPETHAVLLEQLTIAEKAQIIGQTQVAKQRAYFHLPSEEVIVFDAKRNAITSWTGLNVGCMAEADAEGDSGELLVGDADNGYVYVLNGDDDDGTVIDTTWKSAYLDMQSTREKEVAYFRPYIDILDESGTYEVYTKYDVDFQQVKGLKSLSGSLLGYLDWGTDNWGEAYWGSGNEPLTEPHWLHDVRGRHISFEIKSGNRIRLKGFDARWRRAGWL